MTVVVAPGQPLAAKQKPTWVDLAALPCVMPPPWASLRVKLNQMVYHEGLYPPVDFVGSASFPAQISFLHQGGRGGLHVSNGRIAFPASRLAQGACTQKRF